MLGNSTLRVLHWFLCVNIGKCSLSVPRYDHQVATMSICYANLTVDRLLPSLFHIEVTMETIVAPEDAISKQAN